MHTATDRDASPVTQRVPYSGLVRDDSPTEVIPESVLLTLRASCTFEDGPHSHGDIVELDPDDLILLEGAIEVSRQSGTVLRAVRGGMDLCDEIDVAFDELAG
jgi:hypothetical protein